MREQMTASTSVSTPMDHIHVVAELAIDSLQMDTTALVSSAI
jgi:hypothetical protein